MKLHIVDNYEQMSALAADMIAARIKAKKDLVLGMATGSTPEGLYRNLCALYQAGSLCFEAVSTFNLDEYVGLPAGHPQSYSYYMHQHFFNHVNVPGDRINLPSCSAAEPEKDCFCYDEKIEQYGGIDLQILGIGVNGHIGFNEPAAELRLNTHVVELAPETIASNSRFFNCSSEVPRQAITIGLGPIMRANEIMLLASGKSKAKALQKSFSGTISTGMPGSFLQLHRGLHLIADAEAAFFLTG